GEPNAPVLWIACGLLVYTLGAPDSFRAPERPRARGVASRRHDLRLDRLVLRIGDELRVEQLLRFAQTAHRITLGARRRRSCRRGACARARRAGRWWRRRAAAGA